jgi:transcriptional regulator with XRE-family HTH domain
MGQTLGDYIRQAIDSKRLTIEDAAELCGVGKTTLAQTLTGHRIPGPVTLKRIAAVLGLDVATMMQLAGHIEQPQAISPTVAEASLLLSQLPQEEQERLVAMIHAYVDKRHTR